MVKVQRLTKSFGDIRAVDDLSFEVEAGEIVGFLGPNGAGKTTTMRLMTGFLAPDTGWVEIAGIPVHRQTVEAQTRVGYLPENAPLYQNMLVAEVLNLSADLKQIPRDKRRKAFDFVVSAVAISEVFYRPVSELSKGYRQRVGLGIALLHRPSILILDEPTQGLDPNQRTEIRALIKELAEDRTIIMSTHVMQEATAVCDRMVIINQGRLVAEGTTEELSRLAQSAQVLVVDIEGKKVASALRGLGGVAQLDVQRTQGERLEARLTLEGEIELRPEISHLAHQRKWTIWKLVEEEKGMEDIFQSLTRS